MRDTWEVDGYDLLPKLWSLSIPTLIISGDHEFIPDGIAVHIARAIPGARLVTIRNCAYFVYLERSGDAARSTISFGVHCCFNREAAA